MVAMNLPLMYFLNEDLYKNTMNFLWAGKNANVHNTLQNHMEQQMTFFHCQSTTIGLDGES